MGNAWSRTPGRWGVFVSYRRGQTSGQARALHDRLEQKFGHGRVFMDVDSISPGADFEQKIHQAIDSCSVMLALIGPDWISRGDVESALDKPDDFVRVELLTALEQGIDVIPILVERTPMPREADLPEPLRPLTRRNALELENARWDTDVKRLVGTLERGSFGRKRHRNRVRRVAMGSAALLTLGLIALLIYSALPQPQKPQKPTALAQLQKLIPAQDQKNCSKAKHFADPHESAEYDCTGRLNSPAAAVFYELYPSNDAMTASYYATVTSRGGIEGVGCGSEAFVTFADKCETDVRSNAADKLIGRVFEYYSHDQSTGGTVPVIVATSNKHLLILALVGNTSDKGDDLVQYWNDGPDFIEGGA